LGSFGAFRSPIDYRPPTTGYRPLASFRATAHHRDITTKSSPFHLVVYGSLLRCILIIQVLRVHCQAHSAPLPPSSRVLCPRPPEIGRLPPNNLATELLTAHGAALCPFPSRIRTNSPAAGPSAESLGYDRFGCAASVSVIPIRGPPGNLGRHPPCGSLERDSEMCRCDPPNFRISPLNFP
jgi:hypothetical protein